MVGRLLSRLMSHIRGRHLRPPFHLFGPSLEVIGEKPWPWPNEPRSAPWEAVIGLQIHVRLLRVTRAVVDDAILAALALGCRVDPASGFVRQASFGADLPGGRAVRYDPPIGIDGKFVWGDGARVRRVRILRVHMEEHVPEAGARQADARPDEVDPGVGGLEIATGPDLRSAMDAWQFVGALQELLVEAGVHAGGLVEGDPPCEAVVSVRSSGTNSAGTPVRVNVPLGSWPVSDSASPRVLASRLEDQLRKEIDRQTTLLAAGKAVRHETRTHDAKERRALSRGPRETSFNCQFYRKADVRAIGIDRAYVERLRAMLPYLPSPFSEWTTVRARYRDLEATFGLSPDRLHHIAKSREMAAYFRGMVAAGAAPEPAARWLRGELARALRRKGLGIHQCGVGPDAMASRAPWGLGAVTSKDAASRRRCGRARMAPAGS